MVALMSRQKIADKLARIQAYLELGEDALRQQGEARGIPARALRFMAPRDIALELAKADGVADYTSAHTTPRDHCGA